MARPIDADSLLEAVKAITSEPHPDPILGAFHATECSRFLALIRKATTMDVVEVVRCKDCEHYWCDECHNLNGPIGTVMDTEDFCSCGERRK